LDVLVVALKSRSIASERAVALSTEAFDALRSRGAERVIFKYCSTFDSTDAGNIGPVADALLERSGADIAIYCPAYPENARRLFGGYLFVGEVLLSESGMRDHPVTPMRDANLMRVLQRQTPHAVDRVDLADVRRGAAAVRERIARLRARGVRHAIVDAILDEDLTTIADAVDERVLVTGGAALAAGFPARWRREGRSQLGTGVAFPAIGGPAVVIAGSCSRATLAQVAASRATMATFALDEPVFTETAHVVASALAWARQQPAGTPLLVTASEPPDVVAAHQRRYGSDEASSRVEAALASIARGLRDQGARRFVVAGGETSGATVRALGVEALRIGPQIEPGVPWTVTVDSQPLALALKSGNFGSEDFFARALAMAP
ncbi:MAG: four-carbon acid sugar kinase family protein, partial [Candidatus Eremiobacteraeota bacterium]|nr:four-carbon acid sugar kinase family protein [Candidatus Eremiobacteraeota bacterium]